MDIAAIVKENALIDAWDAKIAGPKAEAEEYIATINEMNGRVQENNDRVKEALAMAEGPAKQALLGELAQKATALVDEQLSLSTVTDAFNEKRDSLMSGAPATALSAANDAKEAAQAKVDGVKDKLDAAEAAKAKAQDLASQASGYLDQAKEAAASGGGGLLVMVQDAAADKLGGIAA